MKKYFEGKRILITGGTSGLGKSLALKLSQNGAEVYVIGINGTSDESRSITFLRCDFTDFQSVVEVNEKLESRNLKFDILVNNAGILSPPQYSETNDGYEKSYQINFSITRFAHQAPEKKVNYSINCSRQYQLANV